jgi:hypothetical protein
LRNRANRHYQDQQLGVTGPINEDLADTLESRIKHKAPKKWEKFPDAPLGEVVTKKLEEREAMRIGGGRRALITKWESREKK